MAARKRLTAEERMDREMQKLKAMGVTISVTPSAVPGIEERAFGIIAESARRNGIYEGQHTDHAIRSQEES